MSKNVQHLIILLLTFFLMSKCSSYRVSNIQNSSQKNTNKTTSKVKSPSKVRQKIIAFAKEYRGSDYKYGGTTPKGFDCSGFTTFVMKEFGISLYRSSADQSKNGKKVALKNAKPGDLLFFETPSGRINHVGLVIAHDKTSLKMIHSSSSRGIVIDDVYTSSYWKPRLKFAKNVVD